MNNNGCHKFISSQINIQYKNNHLQVPHQQPFQSNIKKFVELSASKHETKRHDNKCKSLLLGKYKKPKNTSINASGSFRMNGIEWENIINESGLTIHKNKWIDFNVSNEKSHKNKHKITFIKNSYQFITSFDLEEAYLQQLFSNSYPSKKQYSMIEFRINNKIIQMLIRHTTLESIKRWITPAGSVDMKMNKKTKIKEVVRCSKHSFGTNIEIQLTKDVVLNIGQNKNKKINCSVLNSEKKFAHGVGYCWMKDLTMRPEILLHHDFLRQVQMNIYVKKNMVNNIKIKCCIINNSVEYADNLMVVNYGNNNNNIEFPQNINNNSNNNSNNNNNNNIEEIKENKMDNDFDAKIEDDIDIKLRNEFKFDGIPDNMSLLPPNVNILDDGNSITPNSMESSNSTSVYHYHPYQRFQEREPIFSINNDIQYPINNISSLNNNNTNNNNNNNSIFENRSLNVLNVEVFDDRPLFEPEVDIIPDMNYTDLIPTLSSYNGEFEHEMDQFNPDSMYFYE